MHQLGRVRLFSVVVLAASILPMHDTHSRPVLLMTDTSVEQVSGARERLGFERLPDAGERVKWKDPDGRADNIAVSLLAGGGLIGAGVSDVHAQSERNSSIQLLRDAMAHEGQLQRTFDRELRHSLQHNGFDVQRAIRADSLADGHVRRGFAQGQESLVFAIQQIPGYQAAVLSWDDRQPLLSIDARQYARKELARSVTARQKLRRVVHYVGLEAPEGQDYLAYWSADNGRAYLAEVEAGLKLMLPLAWDATLEVPKVTRREQVVLQVRGQPRAFPGRLWKHEAGAAYLFTPNRAITIVATEPAASH